MIASPKLQIACPCLLPTHSRFSSMEEEKEMNASSRLDSHPGAMAAVLLTDDLILEILSRLPARSVHRFKCVSVPWRDLIADPANRNKLPHTLAGFIYITYNHITGRHRRRLHFASVSGDDDAPFDPRLPPSKYMDMYRVDACNGLLLYRRYDHKDVPHFAVCNPATGRWAEVPPLPPKPQTPVGRDFRVAGLAFDPAVSSNFHVLYFETAYSYTGPSTIGVDIYSSQKGAWSHSNIGTVEKVKLFYGTTCVFVAGMMYLRGELWISDDYVLVGVDMEGKLWTTICVPNRRRFAKIGSSQGCLHYAMLASLSDSNNVLVSEISLWCLKDRDTKEFVLKHTASFDKLMGMTGLNYGVVGIHPDCDTVFLLSYEHGTLVSFDMQHQRVGRILNLEKDYPQQFLPYVPLFSEPLADADVDGQ